MIEFVNDKERNLKNLKQIGTPKENNKIYMEHQVYAKIKENSYREKRVFVLMGHTERMEGRYLTFIEGIIPVREIEFQGNTPRWNNSTWSEIFKEIKYRYEDMIIVGWAVDIKGMSPKMTLELERVHREHFGGIHQLLFLLDTIEQEETFYVYKDNKVAEKDGFYIYHKAQKKNMTESETERERIPVKIKEKKSEPMVTSEKQVDIEVDVRKEQQESPKWEGGRYRRLMNEKKPQKVSGDGNMGMAIAVAMLIFVIGVGIYEDRDKLWNNPDSVPTNVIQEENTNMQMGNVSEEEPENTEAEANTIPMDVISGTQQAE